MITVMRRLMAFWFWGLDGKREKKGCLGSLGDFCGCFGNGWWMGKGNKRGIWGVLVGVMDGEREQKGCLG